MRSLRSLRFLGLMGMPCRRTYRGADPRGTWTIFDCFPGGGRTTAGWNSLPITPHRVSLTAAGSPFGVVTTVPTLSVGFAVDVVVRRVTPVRANDSTARNAPTVPSVASTCAWLSATPNDTT